jgi:hypothetical protein
MKLLGLVFLSGFILAATANADFVVSPKGEDANPGTEERPFATLEAARDAIRRIKETTGIPAGGITVWIRQGDHLRTRAFELTAADSGAPDAPISWRAFQNEVPRLLGGRQLTGFKPVSDAAVLARLAEPGRSNILQCDLRALGIADFGEMKSRGFGRSTTTAHCELFFGGQPMVLARWPNEGAFDKINGFPEGSAQGDDHGGKIGGLENGFYYEGDRPRHWRATGDLWVHGYWAWDWANSYERVAALDVDTRLVMTAPPHGLYGFRKGQRIYFLNVLEELDQPGEWFLDRHTGLLYFWPPEAAGSLQATATERAGSDFQSGPEVLLSQLDEPLLKLTEVSHLNFLGLTLEATRGNAVEIRGGTGNRVAGCLIRNIGNYGVKISGGARHGVIGCDIFGTGDGGVELVGGDRATLTSAGHFVENCHFQNQGRWSKCYVPAIHMVGAGLRASHNLIHDHPHCAILFNGNDHLIEFNEIHRIALETGDVGAIYTGRDYTYRGNRIRHNFIHHTGGVGMGSMGVYMDDCVSGAEIYGNIFFKVQRAAFLGGGRDHSVINNIFVECNHAVELDGRGLDKSPVWRNMVDVTMRQRLDQVPLALYRQRYPAMKSLDAHYGPPGGPAITGNAFKGVPPEGNVAARNVSVGKWLHVYWHATEGMLQLENNLTNAAASFVRLPGDNSRATDFELRPDSPAWKLGFERIPAELIGLREDPFRRALPQLNGR